jgi:hypothetical protein
MIAVARWGPILIVATWAWVLLVLALTFWRAWDIPARLPEINEIATVHLFLAPVSLLLFMTLSWMRLQRDESGGTTPAFKTFPRWTATIVLWLLLFLHPVSCSLYPAVFNLDKRTVEEITQGIGKIQVGTPRAEVERQILVLNATLPITTQTAPDQHRANQRLVEQYLAESDPAVRARLWPQVARAILVFVPWGNKPGMEPDPAAPEQLFQRRMRASSDIGADRLRIRYSPTSTLEELVYSSNRQLTEFRRPCTIHLIVPAPPEASFPYPCPTS